MTEKKKGAENTIGERAKMVRKQLGLTQVEMVRVLAENGIETSQSVISSIEKGTRKPTLEILELVGKKWNVDLNWLLIGHAHEKQEKAVQMKNSAEELESMLETLPQDKQEMCRKFIAMLKEEEKNKA